MTGPFHTRRSTPLRATVKRTAAVPMSDNTIHLLRELLELVAGTADPELELAQVCVELRGRQTDQESRNRP